MDKTTRTILIIVGVILLLGVCCCVSGILFFTISGRAAMTSMIMDEPQEAIDEANEYIQFDLPTGYDNAAGMNMGFVKMIFFSSNAIGDTTLSNPIIALVAINQTADLDPEYLRVQVESSMMGQYGNGFDMQMVDQYTGEINEYEVEFFVFAGTDSNGDEMKGLVTSTFPGSKGSVMLYIMGSAAGWDQSLVDQFLDSIH